MQMLIRPFQFTEFKILHGSVEQPGGVWVWFNPQEHAEQQQKKRARKRVQKPTRPNDARWLDSPSTAHLGGFSQRKSERRISSRSIVARKCVAYQDGCGGAPTATEGQNGAMIYGIMKRSRHWREKAIRRTEYGEQAREGTPSAYRVDGCPF